MGAAFPERCSDFLGALAAATRLDAALPIGKNGNLIWRIFRTGRFMGRFLADLGTWRARQLFGPPSGVPSGGMIEEIGANVTPKLPIARRLLVNGTSIPS